MGNLSILMYLAVNKLQLLNGIRLLTQLGTYATTFATYMKTSLKNRLGILSNYFTITPIPLVY